MSRWMRHSVDGASARARRAARRPPRQLDDRRGVDVVARHAARRDQQAARRPRRHVARRARVQPARHQPAHGLGDRAAPARVGHRAPFAAAAGAGALREQPRQAFARRGRDAALGDDAGDEARGRDVEARVVRGAAGRRDAHARAVARRRRARDRRHLVGRALLDRDAASSRRAVDRPVDRRRGRRDVERDAAVARRERLQVRADLVDHVARRRRPVRADQHDVDLPALHQVPARVVDDHRVRDAVRAQLPRGQRGALVARPRLVDPDVNRNARVVRRVDARQRRPPVDRRQPARVAVGEHLDRLPGGGAPRAGGADQRQRVRADRAVDGDVLVGDRVGGGARGVGARVGRQRRQARRHRVQRPAQVDGGGPRRQQRRARGGQRAVGRIRPHRQPDPVRRRRADERRAPHLHRRDRVRDLGDRAQRRAMTNACGSAV